MPTKGAVYSKRKSISLPSMQRFYEPLLRELVLRTILGTCPPYKNPYKTPSGIPSKTLLHSNGQQQKEKSPKKDTHTHPRCQFRAKFCTFSKEDNLNSEEELNLENYQIRNATAQAFPFLRRTLQSSELLHETLGVHTKTGLNRLSPPSCRRQASELVVPRSSTPLPCTPPDLLSCALTLSGASFLNRKLWKIILARMIDKPIPGTFSFGFLFW